MCINNGYFTRLSFDNSAAKFADDFSTKFPKKGLKTNILTIENF